MRVPFDQPQRLQLVDDTAKRDRFDVEKLRESLLIDALVLREVSQNLRPREPRPAGMLFQPLFQQAGYVVQQEAKRGWIHFHQRKLSVHACRRPVRLHRRPLHTLSLLSLIKPHCIVYISRLLSADKKNVDDERENWRRG
jgi:hypothetical protein